MRDTFGHPRFPPPSGKNTQRHLFVSAYLLRLISYGQQSASFDFCLTRLLQSAGHGDSQPIYSFVWPELIRVVVMATVSESVPIVSYPNLSDSSNVDQSATACLFVLPYSFRVFPLLIVSEFRPYP